MVNICWEFNQIASAIACSIWSIVYSHTSTAVSVDCELSCRVKRFLAFADTETIRKGGWALALRLVCGLGVTSVIGQLLCKSSVLQPVFKPAVLLQSKPTTAGGFLCVDKWNCWRRVVIYTGLHMLGALTLLKGELPNHRKTASHLRLKTAYFNKGSKSQEVACLRPCSLAHMN